MKSALEHSLLDLYQMDAKTKSEWGQRGLSGGYEKSADYISKSLKGLKDAQKMAGESVDRAKQELSKPSAGSHMGAKREAIVGHNALQEAIKTAELASSTTSIRNLPNYHAEGRENTQAHALLAEHDKELARSKEMKSSLGRATYGEKEKVGSAIGDFEAKHPRDENGKFT